MDGNATIYPNEFVLMRARVLSNQLLLTSPAQSPELRLNSHFLADLSSSSLIRRVGRGDTSVSSIV